MNNHQKKVKIWDLPTRLFHWALVLCVTGAVISSKIGGNAMVWHIRFGLVVLALLGFRLIWGMVGPRYARFSTLAYSPKIIWQHLLQQTSNSLPHAGHSPSGAASVIAMLSLLLLQTGSGLFSSDSISVEGPLSHLLRDASISWLTWLHVTLQWVLYALVSLHVMAICFYYFAKKINLTRAMLTGYKTGIETPMATDNRWVRVIGLTLLSGSIVVLLYLWG